MHRLIQPRYIETNKKNDKRRGSGSRTGNGQRGTETLTLPATRNGPLPKQIEHKDVGIITSTPKNLVQMTLIWEIIAIKVFFWSLFIGVFSFAEFLGRRRRVITGMVHIWTIWTGDPLKWQRERRGKGKGRERKMKEMEAELEKIRREKDETEKKERERNTVYA